MTANAVAIPGPLIINVEALRNDAEVAAQRAFGKTPRLRATDVHITAENQILVGLRAKDGRMRWAILLEPEGDMSRIGILRFEFTELMEES